MEISLFIIAVLVLSSWVYQIDLDYIKDDYQRWKRNRRK